MPPEDEAAVPETPPTEDTATQEAAPEGTPAEAADPFEKRYNDLRPEYDRTTQRLSQYEQLVDHLQDPEYQAEALEALGLQLAEEERDEDDDWDEDDPSERIEQMENYLEQQSQAAYQAQQEDAMLDRVEEGVDALQKEHGEFDDEELELLLDAAEANPDDDGIPDVKYAYELLTKVADARREKYLASKKGTQLPGGQAAVEDVDIDDEQARIALMADLIGSEDSAQT